MKTKFLSIILLGLMAVATSCKKYLDITPDGRISMDDVWNDPKMAAAYLNSAYTNMNVNQGGARYFTYAFLESVTDLFHDSDDLEPDALIANMWYKGSLTPSYDPTQHHDAARNGNVYQAYWSGIRQCNVFLANIDKAVMNTELDRARFRAEVKVLRAWYYLQLCRKYGPMPIIKEPLPIDMDFKGLTRPESFQEIADYIDQEWQDVKNVPELPWRITVATEKGRMTKAVMLLLRSRAQLYAASPLYNLANDPVKWEKARDYAREAIDLLKANGNYQLYHDSDIGEQSYENYFITNQDFSQSPRDKETIMENQLPTSLYNGFITGMNGFPQRGDLEKAGSCPTQELVDMYDVQSSGLPVLNPSKPYLDDNHLQPNYFTASGYDSQHPYENRDPRFAATVFYNGSYSPGTGITLQTYVGGGSELRSSDRRYTRTGYYLRKFINQNVPAGQNPGTIWKSMRFAELYLNLAEAENEVNGPGQAVTAAMKPIRDRAHMPDIPQQITDKNIMRAYLQKERAVELALEEQRVWDVRRWKILDKTDKLVTGMRITKQNDDIYKYERFVVGHRDSWSDKFLIFPIPLTEVAVLGNDWQNPGW